MKLNQAHIEQHVPWLIILVLLVVSVGGLVEIVPLFFQGSTTTPIAGLKPYSPLALTGRDIYVREGCYNCHSQMIRPFRAETERYGPYSVAGEFVYDHPFQWGSKRTGPDLHRVGGRYPSLWHYSHLMDPRSTSPGSNMPSYAWLESGRIDVPLARKKLALMQKLGVPYTNDDIDAAETMQRRQAEAVVTDLAQQGVSVAWNSEIVALISYLQRLGRDVGVKPVPAGTPVSATSPAEAAPHAAAPVQGGI